MSNSFEDKIAKNRTCPIPAAETVSELPEGYQPTDAATRASRLHKVAKELEAELLAALKEYAATKPETHQQLGEYAPSVAEAKRLSEELDQVQSLLTRLYALTSYAEERKSILLHDARALSLQFKRPYEYHIDQKPGLASAFEKMVKFLRAIGDAISEGRAEAKRQREKKREEEEQGEN